MGSLTDALTSLQVDTVLSYLVAFGVPALDAVLPVLPSETAIIALGVATAAGCSRISPGPGSRWLPALPWWSPRWWRPAAPAPISVTQAITAPPKPARS